MMKIAPIIFAVAVLGLAGCQPPPEPGSKEAAIQDAWESYCSAGYCEGYGGQITSFEDGYIVVNINGNTRYVTYTVTGNSGNYKASVRATADGGKQRPS